MPLVSEKMSVALEILRKVVLENVTAPPRSLDGAWRPAAQWMSVSAASAVGTRTDIVRRELRKILRIPTRPVRAIRRAIAATSERGALTKRIFSTGARLV